MSAAEMSKYISETGFMVVDGFEVEFIIKDARLRWGKLDFFVTPVHGSGQRWIAADRLKLVNKL